MPWDLQMSEQSHKPIPDHKSASPPSFMDQAGSCASPSYSILPAPLASRARARRKTPGDGSHAPCFSAHGRSDHRDLPREGRRRKKRDHLLSSSSITITWFLGVPQGRADEYGNGGKRQFMGRARHSIRVHRSGFISQFRKRAIRSPRVTLQGIMCRIDLNVFLPWRPA